MVKDKLHSVYVSYGANRVAHMQVKVGSEILMSTIITKELGAIIIGDVEIQMLTSSEDIGGRFQLSDFHPAAIHTFLFQR